MRSNQWIAPAIIALLASSCTAQPDSSGQPDPTSDVNDSPPAAEAFVDDNPTANEPTQNSASDEAIKHFKASGNATEQAIEQFKLDAMSTN